MYTHVHTKLVVIIASQRYDLPATQEQAERRPEESLFKDVWLKTLRHLLDNVADKKVR